MLGGLDERQRGRRLEDRLLSRDALACVVVVAVDLQLSPPARHEKRRAQHDQRPDGERLAPIEGRVGMEGRDGVEHAQRTIGLVMEHRRCADRQFRDAPAETEIAEIENDARVQP